MGAKREGEYREHKFMAALKGIDLDDGVNEAKEAFDRAQLKAEAHIRGESLQAATNRSDGNTFGLEFEVEE